MFRPIPVQLDSLNLPELQIRIVEHPDPIPKRVLSEIQKITAAKELSVVPLHILIKINVSEFSSDLKFDLNSQVSYVLKEILTNLPAERIREQDNQELNLPVVLIAKYTLIDLINNLRISLEHMFKVSVIVDEKLKKICLDAEEHQAKFARSPSIQQLSESSRSDSPTFLSLCVTPRSPRPGSRSARSSSLVGSSLRTSTSMVSLQDLDSPKFQSPKPSP